MIDMLKRHAIQVLRQAGHTLDETATFVGVSRKSVQRVVAEAAVTHDDTDAERTRRQVGRPSKAEPFRERIHEWLTAEPELLAVELLRRAKLAGYAGAKSALYELVRQVRPTTIRPMMRFEGLPGEFTQHDFGHVDVRFLDGSLKRVHFFASRLKYSRWVEVSLVANEQVETLVRTLVDHFAAIGGVPLLAWGSRCAGRTLPNRRVRSKTWWVGSRGASSSSVVFSTTRTYGRSWPSGFAK